MKGFVVQACVESKVGMTDSWDNAMFATELADAVEWVRTGVANPDCKVRILPGVAIQDVKRPGQFEIGVLH